MIKIVCVGKIKEAYLKEAILDYQKRMQKYRKVEIYEIPDSNEGEVSKILEIEKAKIEKYIEEKDYIITLEIEGKQMNSLELANTIDYIQQHYANITFIIGSSYGLHEKIKQRANFSLSFSKLTFPHQLFRVLLLEQIYRSYKIINNETYHK